MAEKRVLKVTKIIKRKGGRRKGEGSTVFASGRKIQKEGDIVQMKYEIWSK